jgi:hypothetical protein
MHCDQITDVGVEMLAQGCPNLSILNMGFCTHITDVGLEKLSEGTVLSLLVKAVLA